MIFANSPNGLKNVIFFIKNITNSTIDNDNRKNFRPRHHRLPRIPPQREAAGGADAVFEGAVLPLPVSICVPFAATTIRGYIGLAGFFLSLMLFSKDGLAKLRSAVRDRKAMWCVFASTIFGPFIGVSASLLATQYTSAGIAQTIFALTPILIIAPAAILFHQKVTVREVIGAVISVVGVCLFFV